MDRATADVTTLRQHRSTPVVRRIAAEHGITDLSAVAGTGVSGRVTKQDILAFVAAGGPAAPAAATPAPAPVAAAPATAAADTKQQPAARRPPAAPGDVPAGHEVALVKVPRIHHYANDRVEKMSRMRASIAENMVQARRGTAHCHTVWECDVTRVVRARKALAPEFESRGVKLTYTAFFVAAVVDGLQTYPLLNAAIDGDSIVYRGSINLGVASAIEEGLIVPVLKSADTLNLFGIAKGINDLAQRSKAGKLLPQDVADGTFTISNAGIWGSLFGVPILVQPQVGILGIGGINKRVVADENENIRVRSMVNMCLTFDHRLIDGATADGFMSRVTKTLASWT
ncbi:MAG: 2-oxo acid dehydrogenase subunit E2 [Myxococcales bacterium]|nr:2-oxo acid dehydrogenase subunit E2 [Myxococcales bacterium]